jgi:hypothetical protein
MLIISEIVRVHWFIRTRGRQATINVLARRIATPRDRLRPAKLRECTTPGSGEARYGRSSAPDSLPHLRRTTANERRKAQINRKTLDIRKTDMPVGPDQIDIEINLAIQRLVEKGLVFDTGRKRWSERTCRYETIWASTGAANTRH